MSTVGNILNTDAARHKKWLPLCLLYCLCVALYAHPDQPAISTLGIQQGLSNNGVTCIFQDHQGYMWFGTYDGLNRYDGYEFRVFRQNLNDTNSLITNRIVKITEDASHKLWIATPKGISIYNPATNAFHSTSYFSNAQGRIRKLTQQVQDLATNSRGGIFAGTQTLGLLWWKKGSKTARQIPFVQQQKRHYNYFVPALSYDTKGQLWVFVEDQGLYQFQEKDQSLRLINASIKTANCLVADQKGHIWLGSDKGLYCYDIEHNSYSACTQLSYPVVVHLCLDQQQELWIATDGGGVNILNPATQQMRYLSTGYDKNALSSAAVYAIYEDQQGRKWIGTLRGGINILDAYKNRFQTISHEPFNPNSLINNFTLSFCEDAQRNLWIGTDGGGLSYWNRAKNQFTNYQHQPANPGSLSNNFVTNILIDAQQDVWFATFGGGLNRLRKGSSGFERFKCMDGANEHRNVWALYEGQDKTLWASTLNDTYLYTFNREKNQFEVFDHQLTNVLVLQEDHRGNLWAGTYNQLIKIDRIHKKHQYFSVGYSVRVIHEDQQQNLWIGTEGGGLLLFDPQKNTFIQRYTDKDGLSNNSILQALEDQKAQLWISTFNGLSAFNLKTRRFTNYYQSDGLQSNQFNYNAALALSSGEFLMGGINGFNLFQPDSVTTFLWNAPILFTDVRVNNRSVYTHRDYICKWQGARIAEIRVPYREASLAFDFAALEYSAPDKIVFSYFLEGWDKQWSQAGRNRSANYTRLREGSYRLKIKAQNAENSGQASTRAVMAQLDIVVLPPWYRSVWAYLLYLGLLISAIWQYRRYRNQQAQMKYDLAIAQINTEKEKEISEKKISFFTHISHEFRAPLTLIINPLKELLKQHAKGETELSMVYRNARRLLSLVDQLLLFRKVESVDQNLRIEKFNLGEACREIYLSFSQHATAKEIDFVFKNQAENLIIYADKEKLDIILFNLLSNAFKYTESRGQVILSITEKDKQVNIAVQDTGLGIPPEVNDKLFESFYQVEQQGGSAPTGFGIGLYVSQKLALAHHGRLTYISSEGKGSTFTLTLLKGKTHFGSKYISESYQTKESILPELITEPTALGNLLPLPGKTKKNKSQVIDQLTSELPLMLIVDDNAEMRSYIRQIFQSSFSILEAADGKEAYQLVLHETPDIVISDVMMQQVNGIEMCRQIKENPVVAHIPVILLTASASDEARLRGIEGGAEDYMTKPFDQDLIVARVQNILKGRNRLQEYFYNAVTLQPNIHIAGEHKLFIENCIAVIEKHLQNDDFNVPLFCREMGLSHPTLYKRVKNVSGLTVNIFIRYIRLRKAAELLINTRQSITEVAYQTGFNDLKYFRQEFQKLFEMTPSRYVKEYRRVLGR